VSQTLAEIALPVQISNLSHGYSVAGNPRSIISSLEFNLAPGETVAIVGRSGSGKSTLLNLIGGLEPVQRGTVAVLDQSLSDLNDHERTVLRRDHIGFIYQAFNLIPTLNVGDNITLPLALTGVRIRDRETMLRPLLDAVGLDGRAEDYPDVLSGGEQQRVAIARALIHKPTLVLADEPTGNLDAHSGRQILALLQSLLAEQQSSMVLVTHSLEVAKIADRALLMTNGQLEPASESHLSGALAW